MIPLKQHLSNRAAAARVPLSGAFELTPRCNFRCKMCYVRLDPHQMPCPERSAEEWLELGRQARDAGMVFLLLTGGEPFLRRDFARIYEGLTDLGLSITINTNGSLLSDDLKTLFRRLPPAMVNVTLYAPNPEGYATLCGNPQGFHGAVAAVEFFQSLRTVVNLNATITPWNRAGYDGIWELGRKMGLPPRIAAYNFPPTRCPGAPEFTRLPPQEVGQLLAQDLLRAHGPERVLREAASFGTGDELPMGCSLEPGEGMGCYAGKSQFWITWAGTMTPCGMLPGPEAQPFEVGFEAAWRQTVANADKIRLCPDCSDCEIRGTCTNCAAVTHGETGRFDGRPDYMCQLNQAYRQTIRQLAQQIWEKNA